MQAIKVQHGVFLYCKIILCIFHLNFKKDTTHVPQIHNGNCLALFTPFWMMVGTPAMEGDQMLGLDYNK